MCNGAIVRQNVIYDYIGSPKLYYLNTSSAKGDEYFSNNYAAEPDEGQLANFVFTARQHFAGKELVSIKTGSLT